MAVLDKDIEILMLKGESATIKVGKVETGEPGSEVTITNSGTTGDAVFDFKIPRGDKGAKGDKGDKGDPGGEEPLIWGNMKGTLTNQTDLVEYIDNKLESITDGDNVSY